MYRAMGPNLYVPPADSTRLVAGKPPRPVGAVDIWNNPSISQQLAQVCS
jgi:hypothetical protein